MSLQGVAVSGTSASLQRTAITGKTACSIVHVKIQLQAALGQHLLRVQLQLIYRASQMDNVLTALSSPD